jgi:hypothetical protein
MSGQTRGEGAEGGQDIQHVPLSRADPKTVYPSVGCDGDVVRFKGSEWEACVRLGRSILARRGEKQ